MAVNNTFNYEKLDLGKGSLYQIAGRSSTQMMSYMIKSPNGEIIMIDGGFYCREDGEYLYSELIKNGGKISLWIITHMHFDHFGALLYMLENKPNFDNEIKIEKLCFEFPPLEWLKEKDSPYYSYDVLFANELKKHDFNVVTPKKGDIIPCGGMSFEFLNDVVLSEKYENANDTSKIFLARFPKRDILFLGDLGYCQSKDLLKDEETKRKIRCDIVQMAHHGQNAAGKEFYSAVMPKICLYPTPDWLWDNDSGKGKGSGPWHTLETRKWMEDLGVKNSCPAAFGDFLFD